MRALPDFHIHTPLCGHAGGEIEQYVIAAKEKGLPEMGFADHLPLFHIDDPTLAMSYEDLPAYIDQVRGLQERHADIPVRLGIEADYVSSHMEEIAQTLALHEFDYIYGSVHFIESWGFDQTRFKYEFDRRDIDDVYGTYFNLVMDAARTGLYDIMTHLDVVKKYGHRPEGDMTGLYHEVARALKKSNVAIELNASGLRKPVREIYPSMDLLRIMNEHGVPITFGSDAHKPAEVGRDFDKLLQHAVGAGYSDYVTFKGRERIPHPLVPE